MILASSRFYEMANWVLTAVVSNDWKTWNTDIGDGMVINWPLSVFVTVFLTVLVNIVIAAISIPLNWQRWKWQWEAGYNAGQKSKAVKLGRIKFGGKVKEENFYIMVYGEDGKKEYDSELDEAWAKRHED